MVVSEFNFIWVYLGNAGTRVKQMVVVAVVIYCELRGNFLEHPFARMFTLRYMVTHHTTAMRRYTL
jgi:hypothetical protein